MVVDVLFEPMMDWIWFNRSLAVLRVPDMRYGQDHKGRKASRRLLVAYKLSSCITNPAFEDQLPDRAPRDGDNS